MPRLYCHVKDMIAWSARQARLSLSMLWSAFRLLAPGWITGLGLDGAAERYARL
ncbi:hypothetical protein [Thermogemmatispora aurantia]|jgi:hypothetical protein|uniref:hypothetical protein n=1 Tax=Thermogemmatispora aurantia TaxID=2045279 RepID=UPI001478295A|nr:hypothetical protein [Thermogemmatispora aurantia]